MKLNIRTKINVGIVIALLGLLVGLLLYPCLVGIPAITSSFPKTINKVIPSVVHIMCDRWQGSGIALTDDIVVTARHVVKEGGSYVITMSDGTTVKGVRAIINKQYDIAFIKVDKPILKPAKFGVIEDCVLGQPVFIIGSPYGKINFNNVSLGIISGLNKDWEELNGGGYKYGWEVVFTADSAAHPGNSGGPVFTTDGICRGLLVGGFSPVLNCSMPVDLFINDVDEIKLLFILDEYQIEEEVVETYEVDTYYR